MTNDAKGVHVYVTEDINDLSSYGIGIANNGGGSDGQEYTFPSISVPADSHILIGNNSNMYSYLGIDDGLGPFDFVEMGAPMNMNGDDAIELYFLGQVVETFGDINIDGNGEDWEYLDSWAYKVDGAWTYGGVNCTDDSTTTCSSFCPYPFVECDGSDNNIYFSVDMNYFPGGLNDSDIVYVVGTFNNWNFTHAMIDNGGGEWNLEIPFENGIHEYKFAVSGDAEYFEYFDFPTENCTMVSEFDDSYINRYFEVFNEDLVLPIVHWNYCAGQDPLSITENTMDNLLIYPNPVDGNFVNILSPINGIKKVEVFSLTGKKLLENTIEGDMLDV